MIFDWWINKASHVKISIYKIILSFTIKYTHKNIQKKNINVQEKYTEEKYAKNIQKEIYTHTEVNVYKYTKMLSIQIASTNAQRYSIRLSRIAFNFLTKNRTAAYQNSGA